ncbi:MAG: hypothetical protein Q4C96_10955, partial [Planctomycetia bacterium]|nr:hypothetical protein [Planctomycetia bacterium]
KTWRESTLALRNPVPILTDVPLQGMGITTLPIQEPPDGKMINRPAARPFFASRPSAHHPGLRTSSSVHGSAGKSKHGGRALLLSGTPVPTLTGVPLQGMGICDTSHSRTAGLKKDESSRRTTIFAPRPTALHPGLRTTSFVHGSGKIEPWRNVLRHFIRDYGLRPPSTAPGKSNHGGTSFGASSGTTDFVLRPRLHGEKSKHGGKSLGVSSGTTDYVLRPRLHGENQNTAERHSALHPGLRTPSSVHGSTENRNVGGTSVVTSFPGLRFRSVHRSAVKNRNVGGTSFGASSGTTDVVHGGRGNRKMGGRRGVKLCLSLCVLKVFIFYLMHDKFTFSRHIFASLKCWISESYRKWKFKENLGINYFSMQR